MEELGQVQRAQDRLDAAALTCQQELENAAEHGHPPLPAAGPAYAGLADVAYQRNELDTALRHAREGIALCLAVRLHRTDGRVPGHAGMDPAGSGNPAGAREAMGEAIQAARDRPACSTRFRRSERGCCWPKAMSPPPLTGPKRPASPRTAARITPARAPSASPGAARRAPAGPARRSHC